MNLGDPITQHSLVALAVCSMVQGVAVEGGHPVPKWETILPFAWHAVTHWYGGRKWTKHEANPTIVELARHASKLLVLILADCDPETLPKELPS